MFEKLPAEQMAKLPQWAQRHIERLNMQIANLESARDQQTPTRVILDPYDGQRYIDEGTLVRFQMPGGKRHLDCSLREPHNLSLGDRSALSVSADSMLTILPGAANTVYIISRRN